MELYRIIAMINPYEVVMIRDEDGKIILDPHGDCLADVYKAELYCDYLMDFYERKCVDLTVVKNDLGYDLTTILLTIER